MLEDKVVELLKELNVDIEKNKEVLNEWIDEVQMYKVWSEYSGSTLFVGNSSQLIEYIENSFHEDFNAEEDSLYDGIEMLRNVHGYSVWKL